MQIIVHSLRLCYIKVQQYIYSRVVIVSSHNFAFVDLCRSLVHLHTVVVPLYPDMVAAKKYIARNHQQK